MYSMYFQIIFLLYVFYFFVLFLFFCKVCFVFVFFISLYFSNILSHILARVPVTCDHEFLLVFVAFDFLSFASVYFLLFFHKGVFAYFERYFLGMLNVIAVF